MSHAMPVLKTNKEKLKANKKWKEERTMRKEGSAKIR